MPEPRRILLGTTNPAKEAAFRRLLDGLPIQLVMPAEAGVDLGEVREEGWTFKDNAEHKACVYAKAAGIPAIASDGGLEVPVLRGRWEGLKSRRFAGPDDADRIAGLLAMLRNVPPGSRSARFHEAVALAEPDGTVVAAVQRPGPIGRLAETADTRSVPGFWVPSLWLYPPRWVTEWDLTDEERSTMRTAWDAVAVDFRPQILKWSEQ